MQDIWKETQAWAQNGQPFVLARVISTWSSAPRGVGASMLVNAQLQIAGSVSGGCIEGAVIDVAQQVLQDGNSRQVEYGVDDEIAWSVGLSCGGTVTVRLERHWACIQDLSIRTVWTALETAINDNQAAMLLTHLERSESPLLLYPNGHTVGNWGPLTINAVKAGLLAYEERSSQQVEIDGQDIFIHVFPQRDQLIIIGAGHISIPLVGFAHALDFRTVVIDPRQVFATPERFPEVPDQLLAQWPQTILDHWDLNEDTYAVVLTHDPEIDDEALHCFLHSPVSYIAALGSRKSHAKRCIRLSQAGFNEAALARIKGPAGLDIRAKTPTEIALSIIAEVIATKRNR